MTSYYLDSSALAKRYVTETGSTWVRGLSDVATDNVIISAEITRVEVAAALAARHRAPNFLHVNIFMYAARAPHHHFDAFGFLTRIDPLAYP
jgi:hypothetical protein